MIESNFREFAKLRIIDALGQVVMQDYLSNQNSYFNIQNLKCGVYVVEVIANDNIDRKKLVKE